jgi:hypothetical protein
VEINKKQYLLENGWWAQYHDDCWFESSKDEFWVNDKGEIVGFRPESEGITLEEAYKIVSDEKGKERL